MRTQRKIQLSCQKLTRPEIPTQTRLLTDPSEPEKMVTQTRPKTNPRPELTRVVKPEHELTWRWPDPNVTRKLLTWTEPDLNRNWPKPVLTRQNPNLTRLITNLTWIQPDLFLTRPEINPTCYKPDPKSTWLVIDLTQIQPDLLLTRPEFYQTYYLPDPKIQPDLLLTRLEINTTCYWPDLNSTQIVPDPISNHLKCNLDHLIIVDQSILSRETKSVQASKRKEHHPQI